jgi:uncharacterized protein (TIGR03086 family)
MDNVRDLFGRALARFGHHVHAVGDGQWHLPTPCAEWDVHQLINHLVSENGWMPPLLAGGTVEEVGTRLDGDLLGEDPKGAWEGAAAEAGRAVRETPLDRTVHLSGRDVPASQYVFEVFADLAIHAWDLAQAIGADGTIDPDVVEVVYAEYKPLERLLKSSGQYGERIEAPPDASPQTKLLALFGRLG